MKKIVTIILISLFNYAFGQDVIDQSNQLGLPVFKQNLSIKKDKVFTIDCYVKANNNKTFSLVNHRVFDKNGFILKNIDYSPTQKSLILNIRRPADSIIVSAVFNNVFFQDFKKDQAFDWIYYNWNPYRDLVKHAGDSFVLKKIYNVKNIDSVVVSNYINETFVNTETLNKDFLDIFFHTDTSAFNGNTSILIDSVLQNDTLILVSKTNFESNRYMVKKDFFIKHTLAKRQEHYYSDSLLINTYIWKYDNKERAIQYEEFINDVFGMNRLKLREIKYDALGNRTETQTTNFISNIPDEKIVYDVKGRITNRIRFHPGYDGPNDQLQTQEWKTSYNKIGLVEKETYLLNKKIQSETLFKYSYY